MLGYVSGALDTREDKSRMFWLGCGLICVDRHFVDPFADPIYLLESRGERVAEEGPVMTAQWAFGSRTNLLCNLTIVAAHDNLSLRLVPTCHNPGWLAGRHHQRGCLLPYLTLVSRQRSTVTGSAGRMAFRTVGWLKLSQAGLASREGRGREGRCRGPPWPCLNPGTISDAAAHLWGSGILLRAHVFFQGYCCLLSPAVAFFFCFVLLDSQVASQCEVYLGRWDK